MIKQCQKTMFWILLAVAMGGTAQAADDTEGSSAVDEAAGKYSECVNQYIGPLGKKKSLSPREVAIAAYQRCNEDFDAYAEQLIDELESKMQSKDEWRKYITRTVVKQNLRTNSLDYITDIIIQYREGQ